MKPEIVFAKLNLKSVHFPTSDTTDHQVIRLPLLSERSINPKELDSIKEFIESLIPNQAQVSVSSINGEPMTVIVNINGILANDVSSLKEVLLDS